MSGMAAAHWRAGLERMGLAKFGPRVQQLRELEPLLAATMDRLRVILQLPCLGRGHYTEDTGYAVLPTPWSSSPWKFAVMVVWRRNSNREDAFKVMTKDMMGHAGAADRRVGARMIIMTAKRVTTLPLASLQLFTTMKTLPVPGASVKTLPLASLDLASPPRATSSGQREPRTRTPFKDIYRSRVAAALKNLDKEQEYQVRAKCGAGKTTYVDRMPLFQVELIAEELGV